MLLVRGALRATAAISGLLLAQILEGSLARRTGLATKYSIASVDVRLL
jgi:hypothetical protein